MNCFDDCKYYYDSYIDNGSCKLKPGFTIPDDRTFSCPDYTKARNCLTCKYASYISYSMWIVDFIDYRCGFNKNPSLVDDIVYSDSEPTTYHHYDIPKCPNGNWKGDNT